MNISDNSTLFVTPPALEDVVPNGENPIINYFDRDAMQHGMTYFMVTLNLVGVFTNLINVRVFLEQGVRHDSTNIAFVSLSTFDLLSSATLLPAGSCYFVRYVKGVADFYTCLAHTNTSVMTHIIFQTSGAWVTVYMAVMRSLCVVFPLKFKMWFTPKVTIISILCIFVFFTGMQTTYISSVSLVWVFSPAFNKTIAINMASPFAKKFMVINTIIINQVLVTLAIVIVSIATATMIQKLYQVRKWRQKNATNSGNETKTSEKTQLASKDIEMIKSVTTATLIFLVCVSMAYIPALAVVVLPGVGFGGFNENVYHVLFTIRICFSAVNSSINFFFYIRISSRYKSAFASAFPIFARKVKE